MLVVFEITQVLGVIFICPVCHITPIINQLSCMVSTSMLGYVKQILSKVSFDLALFEKELRKSIRLVVKEELTALRRWCLLTFKGSTYRLVIDRCFHFAA